MTALISLPKSIFFLVHFIINFSIFCTQSIEKNFLPHVKINQGVNNNKLPRALITIHDSIYLIIKDKSNEIEDLTFLLQSDIKCHSRYVLKADQARLELVLTQKEQRRYKQANNVCLIYQIRIARLRDIINNYGLRERLMYN